MFGCTTCTTVGSARAGCIKRPVYFAYLSNAVRFVLMQKHKEE